MADTTSTASSARPIRSGAGWRKKCYGLRGRSSWDETAVIAAVCGEESHFGVARGRYRIDPQTGIDEWEDDPSGPHARLVEKTPKEDVGGLIDSLIAEDPGVSH